MVAVAQVDTVQITSMDGTPADTTYILKVGGRTISVVGDTDEDTTATNLAAAWEASTQPEFVEVAASATTDTVTLTANTAGVEFVAVSSVSGGAGTIGAVTAVTANAGPNVWAAGNFTIAGVTAEALPEGGDTVVFENNNVDCLYGLDQNAVTLLLMVQYKSFTGRLGLPRWNDGGYAEYRDQYLKISATTLELQKGAGSGSGRWKQNLGTVQTAATVYGNATRAEAGIPTVLLLGTHVANVLNIEGAADVGVAFFGGEVSTIATVTMGEGTSGRLVLGETSTLATVNVRGGTVEASNNVTTINQTAGTMTLRAAATVTNWTVDGGTAYYNSSGTATETINVGGGGILDFRGNQSARTVANANIFSGGAIHDPNKTVTWTNGIDMQRCGELGVTLNTGEHQTVSYSAI